MKGKAKQVKTKQTWCLAMIFKIQSIGNLSKMPNHKHIMMQNEEQQMCSHKLLFELLVIK